MPAHGSRAARSKGCKECIQRRVKCDERCPCCKQCARFGLPCSGPVRGVIFLDMTEKASCSRRSRGSPRVKGKARREDSQVERTPGPANSAPSDTPTTFDLDCSSDCFFGDFAAIDEILATSQRSFEALYSLPSLPPHLNTTNSDEFFFISKFVTLITSPRSRPRSWLFELPNIVSTSSMPSMRYAARAAALMYYAIIEQNRDAGIDALRWYLAGLASYRAALCGGNADSYLPSTAATLAVPASCFTPDSALICPAMMFLCFEWLQATGPGQGFQHQIAAADMLEARGPLNCRVGLEQGMFRSIRPLETFQSILLNKPAKFYTPDWCSVPFEQDPKLPWDSLMDIMLSFSRRLQLPRYPDKVDTQLRDAIHMCHDLSKKRKHQIEEAAQQLLIELDTWWQQFETGSAIRPHNFDDTLTAGTVALYNAACLILQSIFLILALSKPPSMYDLISPISSHQLSIASHSSSILHAATYLMEADILCGDTHRVMFSLRIVSLLGLEDEKREQAQLMITQIQGSPVS